jgi:hypothetical protein
MFSTVRNEGEACEISIVLWTADQAPDSTECSPKERKDWNKHVEKLIQDSAHGAVFIRDYPAKGPEGLPPALRQMVAWRGDRFFVATSDRPDLPNFEQRLEDWSVADRYAPSPNGSVIVIVQTAADEIRRWIAFFRHHNPDAWISRIDAVGDSQIVQQGVRRCTAPQVQPA